MRVRVLGCSGAIAKDCKTTSFLIDGDLLVDAGTGVGDLTLEEMKGIKHVLLTHSHLDHVAALPLMVDAIASTLTAPIKISALPGTLQALKQHIFNNVIWPDFSRIPTPQAPFISFHEIQVGHTLHLHGERLTLYPGNYSAFERVRAERLAQQASLRASQEREIAHLQKFVDRFKARATKARQAQSRVKMIERIQLVAPHWGESALLNVAHAYQQVTDWHRRRPPLCA